MYTSLFGLLCLVQLLWLSTMNTENISATTPAKIANATNPTMMR